MGVLQIQSARMNGVICGPWREPACVAGAGNAEAVVMTVVLERSCPWLLMQDRLARIFVSKYVVWVMFVLALAQGQMTPRAGDQPVRPSALQSTS